VQVAAGPVIGSVSHSKGHGTNNSSRSRAHGANSSNQGHGTNNSSRSRAHGANSSNQPTNQPTPGKPKTQRSKPIPGAHKEAVVLHNNLHGVRQGARQMLNSKPIPGLAKVKPSSKPIPGPDKMKPSSKPVLGPGSNKPLTPGAHRLTKELHSNSRVHGQVSQHKTPGRNNKHNNKHQHKTPGHNNKHQRKTPGHNSRHQDHRGVLNSLNPSKGLRHLASVAHQARRGDNSRRTPGLHLPHSNRIKVWEPLAQMHHHGNRVALE